MHYNVPQFIDIEDRIVGPLTAKQLLWIFAMGAVLFLMWMMIESKVNFFIAAIPVAGIFLALAFYRPYGQPLIKFIGSMFIFFVRPKIYIWRRGSEMPDYRKNLKKKETETVATKKDIHQKEIYDLSKILDSQTDILNDLNKKE